MKVEINLWQTTKKQLNYSGNIKINQGEQIFKIQKFQNKQQFIVSCSLGEAYQELLDEVLCTWPDHTLCTWLDNRRDFVLWDQNDAGPVLFYNNCEYKLASQRRNTAKLNNTHPDLIFRNTFLLKY